MVLFPGVGFIDMLLIAHKHLYAHNYMEKHILHCTNMQDSNPIITCTSPHISLSDYFVSREHHSGNFSISYAEN